MGETLLRYLPLLFGADALLVVAHLVWGTDRFWNLDREHNLPTWFSGIQLVLVALASLDCYEGERRSPRRLFPPAAAWAVLAPCFLYLSLDETTVIHEGVMRNEIRDLLPPDSLWISLLPWQIVFGPALAVLAALMLALFVTRFVRTPALLAPAVGGLGCWALAVFAEGLAKPVFMARGWYRAEVAIEEGLELLGATLLVLAFARYAAALRSGTGVAVVDVRGQGRRIAFATLALIGFITAAATVVVAVSLHSSTWLHRHNASQLAKRGKHAEAAVAYQEALAHSAEDADSLAGLARSMARLGRHEEALRAYDRALALRPRDAALWNGRGAALYRLDRLSDAEGSFRRAVEIRSREVRAWRNLGHVLAKQGRREEAAEAYRRALDADPGDERSRRSLERLEAGR